ncbi:MAG: hypothetical protein M0R75_06930 [Dehalococcoidia bacterium]|nr:hypothetical protein [Dehalococcoidia bacterium]
MVAAAGLLCLVLPVLLLLGYAVAELLFDGEEEAEAEIEAMNRVIERGGHTLAAREGK